MTEPALREGVSVSVDPTLWGLRHAHDPQLFVTTKVATSWCPQTRVHKVQHPQEFMCGFPMI